MLPNLIRFEYDTTDGPHNQIYLHGTLFYLGVLMPMTKHHDQQYHYNRTTCLRIPVIDSHHLLKIYLHPSIDKTFIYFSWRVIFHQHLNQ